MAKLKAILRAHKLPYLGSKDELVLRVFMLRQGHRSEASLKERNAMVDLINVAKYLIMAEQLMNLTNHIHLYIAQGNIMLLILVKHLYQCHHT